MASTRSKTSSTISQDLKEYFENLIEPLAKSTEINRLIQRLEDQEKKITELYKENERKDERILQLESTVALKKHHMDILIEKCDDVEQYTRRHSVRINGIEGGNVKSEDIFEVLDKCYNDSGLPFDRNEINRAHRVGKVKVDEETNRRTQSIIVQYKSWDARCKLYQNRPKKKPGIDRKFTVSLDLTKRRLNLLNDARNEIVNYPSVSYAFSDINCNIVLKMANGDFKHFNNGSGFKALLKNEKYVEY